MSNRGEPKRVIGGQAAMSSLVEAMSAPAFYPERPERVECRETHTAFVFLTRDYAYKVKKPLWLPFIDCSTPAKRRALCECEVNLNRRLAPDVYLGVVPIVTTARATSSARQDSATK